MDDKPNLSDAESDDFFRGVIFAFPLAMLMWGLLILGICMVVE